SLVLSWRWANGVLPKRQARGARRVRNVSRFSADGRSEQQLLNFFPGQRAQEFFFSANGCADEFALAVLQRQNLLLDGIASNQFVAGDHLGLADAMCAVGRLFLDSRVPPGIKMNDGVRAGKVQTGAACLETDEEH